MKFKDLFGWFSSGPEAANKVLDGAINGLDKLVYTEEEKVDAHRKLSDWWLELQKTLGEETSVRGITRRLLTFLTVLPYTAMVVVAAAVWPWYKEYSAFLLSLAESNFGIIVLTIVVFYFGPLVGRIFSK